jgi:hypothetical protein
LTESRVSLVASDLQGCSAETALDFADAVLGNTGWSASLIDYRLTSAFQNDWKVEVGRWLVHADRCNYLNALQRRLSRARNEAAAPVATGENDSAHLILNQELAPAMVSYYLCAIGWRFVAWEPPIASGDVDIRLGCPLGRRTDIQVKAPDKPGRVVAGRIENGENDCHVLKALDKACKQLQAAPGPQRMVIMVVQRTFPIAEFVLTRHLIGRTSEHDGELVLKAPDRGTFAQDVARNVGAVMDLSLGRGIDETVYRATVFVNPWAEKGSAPAVACFPGSRSCALEGERFAWKPEQPQRAFSLPTGTRYSG